VHLARWRLGGLLAVRSFELTGVVGAIVASAVVPVVLMLLHEPHSTRPRAEVWRQAAREVATLRGAGLCDRSLLSADGHPPLTPEFIGMLAFVSGGLALCVAALYGFVYPHLRLAARATARERGGLGFALMMSVRNAALGAGGHAGCLAH